MFTPPPEICSCAALRRAARHVTRHYDTALSPTGLGLNQYAILARLGRLGAQNLQDLADSLVMDRSTLGRLLRPLEARGVVSINVDAADKRRRMIALTEAGSLALGNAKPLWAAAEREFESRFGELRAMTLRRILKDVEGITFEDRTNSPPIV